MMYCVHGHNFDCGCGDCDIARCRSSSYAAIAALREPRDRALIACQIQSGTRMTWTDRTYEVERSLDDQWIIYLGECAGPGERRRSWDEVLDGLRRMRPRNVELLEIT
jgi:hypothetical protein